MEIYDYGTALNYAISKLPKAEYHRDNEVWIPVMIHEREEWSMIEEGPVMKDTFTATQVVFRFLKQYDYNNGNRKYGWLLRHKLNGNT